MDYNPKDVLAFGLLVINCPCMPCAGDYDQATADRVCQLLIEGQTLREVCRSDPTLPAESTVRLWALEDKGPGFAAQYARAREIGYHAMADEVLNISDDGSNDWMERATRDGSVEMVVNHDHVTRSRLRFDARRWLLSKALPKIYGDKIQHTGADGGPLQVQVVKFTDDDDTQA